MIITQNFYAHDPHMTWDHVEDEAMRFVRDHLRLDGLRDITVSLDRNGLGSALEVTISLWDTWTLTTTTINGTKES